MKVLPELAEQWTQELIGIAVDAAKVIMQVYGRSFEVEYKGPHDPVTIADRLANDLILSRLEQLAPGVPVVAEESAPETYLGYQRSECVFFVDPLDGTRDFVARNGEFVVMVGLLEGDRPTLGVIHAPVQRTSWVGAVGRGAFQVLPDGTRRSLRVSAVSDVSEARVVVSRTHRGQALSAALSRLGASTVRTVGSAGLKGTSVAEGSAEVYLAVNAAGQRWDACAVDAVVSAAGGRVTDTRGNPIDYRSASLVNDQGLVVTNGQLHDQVMDRLSAS